MSPRCRAPRQAQAPMAMLTTSETRKKRGECQNERGRHRSGEGVRQAEEHEPERPEERREDELGEGAQEHRLETEEAPGAEVGQKRPRAFACGLSRSWHSP